MVQQAAKSRCLHRCLFSPSPTGKRGPPPWACVTAKKHWAWGNLPSVRKGHNTSSLKADLCKHSVSEIQPRESRQSLAFLAYPAKTCKALRTHGKLPLPSSAPHVLVQTQIFTWVCHSVSHSDRPATEARTTSVSWDHIGLTVPLSKATPPGLGAATASPTVGSPALPPAAGAPSCARVPERPARALSKAGLWSIATHAGSSDRPANLWRHH